MRADRVDEVLLVKYLLGNLSEEEQVQVEDRAFADTDYSDALEAAETDLIDAYVRGELPQPDRGAFERRFLISPSRRSKVEFAKAFAAIAAETTKPGRAAPPLTFWRLIRGWPLSLRFAGGLASFICIAGLASLIFQNVAMRSRLAALEARRGDLETGQQRLRRQLQAEQARAASLAAQSQQPESAGGANTIASLILLPGLSRGEAQAERLLLVPSVQLAHIEIHLEPRDDYTRFRAELRTRSGEEVMIRSNLSRRHTSAGNAVSFDLPASALPQGQYELVLKGLTKDQPVEDLGYYYFEVRGQ